MLKEVIWGGDTGDRDVVGVDGVTVIQFEDEPGLHCNMRKVAVYNANELVREGPFISCIYVIPLK